MRIKNLNFNIEVSDIVIPEFCPILKVPFDKNNLDYTPSIDKIDPKLGYVKENIRIISNKANRIKSNATKEEIQAVLNYIENSKI